MSWSGVLGVEGEAIVVGAPGEAAAKLAPSFSTNRGDAVGALVAEAVDATANPEGSTILSNTPNRASFDLQSLVGSMGDRL